MIKLKILFVYLFICLFVVLVLFPAKASASGLSLGVSPPILQIEAEAPASIKAPITVENLGDEDIELSILFKPFKASPKENGEVSYLPADEVGGADPFIFQKIHIVDNNEVIDSLTLAPGQQKELFLSIEIPRDEPPSDYYFSITFLSKTNQFNQENNQSLSVGGISTNVLLSIGPKGTTQGTLEEFSTPFFLEKGPVPFTVRLKNTSKYFIVPKGSILIKNSFGQTVGKVDLLPVNVLADSIRSIPDSLESPQAFWRESFLLGFYTATLNLALSDQGPIFTKKIYFVGFPFQIMIGLLIIVFLVLLVRNRLKNRQNRMFCAFVIFIGALILFVVPKKVNAAVLSNAQDLITTSRPSASAPLSIDQTQGAAQVTIVDNGSIFLASDSAMLLAGPGEIQESIIIASASAQTSGTPNTRSLYFVSPATNPHHKGDVIIAPVKAMHKVQFTTVNAVPGSGKIIITFPGTGDNTASPSASTFAFNGLSSSNVKINGATCATLAILAPSITCTLDSSQVAAATTITFLIGCSANSGPSCTTATPTLINPTKTQSSGMADAWRIQIKTQNSSSGDIDSANVKVNTVEGVSFQARVDPTFTVAIAGLPNGINFNSLSSLCPNEKTNSGIDTTPTNVNLGTLNSSVINIAGQAISVTTNATSGYVITATSSGRFKDASTGSWIADANGGNGLTANNIPAPATLPTVGNAAFGIAPCGSRVPSIWTPGFPLAFGSGGRLSNPWNSGSNSYSATIASYTGGPVLSEVTVIRYAAIIGSTTPAGTYSTVFTYIITPVF